MNTNEIVEVPAGTPDKPGIPIDLGYWASQEIRISEVATVTPTKAPELMSAFNRACLELDRLANELELEHQLAVRHADKIRAEVILERVPKYLNDKKLGTARSPLGSEDIRNAILMTQPDYLEALDRSDQIKAMMKLLRGKFDAFERGFRSVRTLVGEQTFNFSGKLGGGTGVAEPGQMNKPGFGKPRY